MKARRIRERAPTAFLATVALVWAVTIQACTLGAADAPMEAEADTRMDEVLAGLQPTVQFKIKLIKLNLVIRGDNHHEITPVVFC